MALNCQFFPVIPRLNVIYPQRSSISCRIAISNVSEQFNPAFDDYVKVLESIRIDRSKIEDGCSKKDDLGLSKGRNRVSGDGFLSRENDDIGFSKGRTRISRNGSFSREKDGFFSGDEGRNGVSRDGFFSKENDDIGFSKGRTRISRNGSFSREKDGFFSGDEGRNRNSRDGSSSKEKNDFGFSNGRTRISRNGSFSTEKDGFFSGDEGRNRNSRDGSSFKEKDDFGFSNGRARISRNGSFSRERDDLGFSRGRNRFSRNGSSSNEKYDLGDGYFSSERDDLGFSRGRTRISRNGSFSTDKDDHGDRSYSKERDDLGFSEGRARISRDGSFSKEKDDIGFSEGRTRSSRDRFFSREKEDLGFSEGRTRISRDGSFSRDSNNYRSNARLKAYPKIEKLERFGKGRRDFSEFSKVDEGVEEKAAFKSFEVFTDVRNRPRVLRMELEEGIQNLAKRLHAADINLPQWKFSRMMHSGGIKFTDHSVLRVVQLLGNYGNWKRVLQVVEWVQSRQAFESYKSRYIYTTVLSVLGRAKRPTEALNVFYSMRKELSSYPDLASYHCIAVILGQAGMMKELFDVIDCMRSLPEKKIKLGLLEKWDPRLEPDLVVFNAVLNACVQQKQWEGAFWVLQELKKKGIKPSNTTLGLVMEVMFVCEKYDLVHEFFDKIRKSSVPGALSYKVLVNTFWREGKVDEAVHAVKEMESRGVVGSASLYYDLARCLCCSGRCQEALNLIEKICKVASKPLVVTYTGLIQACLDSGSIENAAFIFNQMTNFCSPNVVTCNIMLKSYGERGMFQEAKNLFQKILERDGLIYLKGSDPEEKRVSPDKFTFNTMLEACMAAEKWDDFEYVYKKMLDWGHPFNQRRHLRMVMEASRAGKETLLDTTYRHLIQSGRTPPPALLTVKPYRPTI